MSALKELVDLLGEKNAEHLQERIVEIIIARIESDLEQWDEYIFCPESYEKFYDACFEEAKNNVRKQIVGRIEEQLFSAYRKALQDETEFVKGGNENGKV